MAAGSETVLDRLLGHDKDTTLHLLHLCLQLSDEVMDREFDIGHRSLRQILLHMTHNVEVWTALMSGRAPSTSGTGGTVSVAEMIDRFELAYEDFAALAKDRESAELLDGLWTDTLDNPPVRKSYGGAIGHVVTHNMHHRAGVLHILRRLGVPGTPEGDLMSWDQRRRISRAQPHQA